MLKTVHIKNFRGFESFELQNLGRINLLVGKNNSGKTSVLEAIQLLHSGLNLEPLTEIMLNRGEFVWNEREPSQRELDLNCLFYGYKPEDNKITISGTKDNLQNKDTQKNTDFNAYLTWRSSPNTQNIPILQKKVLSINHTQGQEAFIISDYNTLSLENLPYFPQPKDKPSQKTRFINSTSLTVGRMIDLFNEIVLNPEELIVNEALKTIEPKLKRIAPVVPQTSHNLSNLRGGFVVRLADSEQRIPIGSLGDGIWRMLGLALSLACAKGGVLLVDEIDTGLHFTTLTDMWKLLWETAKKLDVQVFATTHSSDCWLSLATIASQDDAVKEGVSIQRIEPHKKQAVAFTEEEIIIAAERGIEVR